MAPIIYTTEGEALKEQIWEETLAEFSFAAMEGIVRGLVHDTSGAVEWERAEQRHRKGNYAYQRQGLVTGSSYGPTTVH